MAPQCDGKSPSDSLYDRHRGLVVSERDVRIEQHTRRRFRWLTVACVAGGAVFVAITTLLILAGIGTLLPTVPAVFLFIIGAAMFTLSGAFVSDIVWVQYWAAPSNGAPPSDPRAPVLIEVRIGAGIVVSQNSRGRGGLGRFSRGVRPDGPALSGLPDELVRQLSPSA